MLYGAQAVCRAILILVVAPLVAAAAEPPPATQPTALVTETFSIPAPDGFAWKKVRELPLAAGKVEIFTAAKVGSAAKIVLIVEPETADTDTKRAARIKGDYNGMVEALHDGGYTDLKGGAPEIKSPVPDRVQFALTGKGRDGKPAFMRGVLQFGKQTYHFQISATSEDELALLAKVTQSIKE